MIDFTAILHGPAYAIYGVPATVTLASGGDPIALTVYDKTSGLEVQLDNGGGLTVPTIRPAALATMASLSAAGLTRRNLLRATLAMNGKTWRIDQTMPKPVSTGEANGELIMLLSEVAA